MNILGIIPAAGFGTRLGLPYPKELLPVQERQGKVITVIESQLLQLRETGVDRVTIVLRPHKQIIRDYLGDTWFGLRLRYVMQAEPQRSREGLPDAVLSAREDASLSIMLMGDTCFTFPGAVQQLKAVMTMRPDAVVGLGAWETNTPERFGILEFEPYDRQSLNPEVHSVIDKPAQAGTAYHWGAVAFRSEFWSYLASETATFSAALHRAAIRSTVIAVPLAGQYIDVGTPSSYFAAAAQLSR